ncbi:hypothetical protein [Streptomyces sp. NPDC053079]|uniref:hypothetical protein n=1 Tax=Streptomyces sp. NPDC053079 TaxID=3365697 RepID=UPI0037D0E1BF
MASSTPSVRIKVRRIAAGSYEIHTPSGMYGLEKIKPLEDVGYGVTARWYLTYPGEVTADGIYDTKREAVANIQALEDEAKCSLNEPPVEGECMAAPTKMVPGTLVDPWTWLRRPPSSHDTRRAAPDAEQRVAVVRPGDLVEATIAGTLPRQTRIRVDREPRQIGKNRTVLSDGRGVDAVYTDSIRVIERAETATPDL